MAERSRRRIQEATRAAKTADTGVFTERANNSSQETLPGSEPPTLTASPAKLTKEQGIREVKKLMALEKTGDVGVYSLMPYCDWQNDLSGGTRPAF